MRWTDLVLLLACAALLLVGPAMALQEWRAQEDARAVEDLTGRAPPRETAHRAAWRLPLTILVFLVGAFGTYACIWAWGNKVVRSVSRRLVALLILGMTALDVAYLVDGAFFGDAPYALRGATIVWAYPIAGILVGGAAQRLAELRDHFGA